MEVFGDVMEINMQGPLAVLCCIWAEIASNVSSYLTPDGLLR